MRRPQKTLKAHHSPPVRPKPVGERPRQTLPNVPFPPRVGRFLWTCRAGFETHLGQELEQVRLHPKLLGTALVESDPPGDVRPAFGRAGFRLLGTVGLDEAGAGRRVADALLQDSGTATLELQSWTLDTERANRFSAEASTFAATVASLLPSDRVRTAPQPPGVAAAHLAQVCVLETRQVAFGVTAPDDAVSLAPGGRLRMRSGPQARSRAGSKLEEALETYRLEPSRGDLCVDLGAAPGGWTERLLARGARVIAVDPARLPPDLLQNKKLRHLQQSAFAFAPEEPADWLFCDMAWRPLEVAQLLAKWAQRKWALHLVANIKLPMNDKTATVERVRRTLTEGGWKQLRVRQLYHDRDEVTVMGRRI